MPKEVQNLLSLSKSSISFNTDREATIAQFTFKFFHTLGAWALGVNAIGIASN